MWFAANLQFESVHDGQPSDHDLWEERLILVQADSESQARTKAELFGKQEEHEYVSATGDRVHWVFRRIEKVAPIDAPTLEDGTELFSRFLKGAEVQSILSLIRDESAARVLP